MIGRRRLELGGRSVLITGAAQGIGLETARAAHARGAAVAVVDRDGPAADCAADALGSRSISCMADVTDRAQLCAAFTIASEQLGGLDVVIANAGVAPRLATVAGTAPQEFERVLAVNLHGVWHTVQAALPHLREGGRLVIVASVYAFLNGTFCAPYAMSKAGVEALARALRVELASEGIGVTTAYFGFVDTALVRDSLQGDPLAGRFEALLPAATMTRRLSPEAAATVLVRGIERGAARVIAPRPWRALDALRGPAAAGLDAALARNRRAQKIIADARLREAQAVAVGAWPREDRVVARKDG